MLQIKNLNVIKNGKIILEDVTVDFPAGKTSFLLGESGSGKSTLLRCIAQVEQHYTGEILWTGENLRTIQRRKRSQLFGFVPQGNALFSHLNLWKNCILSPLLQSMPVVEVNAKVEVLLRELGLIDHGSSMPNELSGGQQQRAMIARALMLEPLFLFLDEPTSALDGKNMDLLVTILLRLQAKGCGFIISTHDEIFAQKIADKRYHIREGRVDIDS